MKKIIVLILLGLSFTSWANMKGALAPDFKRLDQSGKTHQLSDYKGQWLVVYFYPKDDTPGCTIEANEFKDKFSKIKALQANLLGVSMDDGESHQAFKDKYKLPFDLLVDEDKVMSKAYGVVGGVGMLSYAKRQTFVIDPDGNVVKHFEEVTPKTHADDVIAALESAQKLYHEIHGGHTPKEQAKSEGPVVTERFGNGLVYGVQWPRTKQAYFDLAGVLQNPDGHLEGKKVFTGQITQVCQKKGCWMVLTDGEVFARVDFNNHAFLIPKDARGKASVYGQLVKKTLTKEQIEHYQSEGATGLKSVSYELVADAVLIESQS